MSQKNNKDLDFEDLLARKRLRVKHFPIEGLGTVTLHEISASEQWQCTSGYLDMEDEALEKHTIKWAGRMLKGEMPTDEEAEKLRENLGVNVLSEVFNTGLKFNAAAEDSKEQAEKNSKGNRS